MDDAAAWLVENVHLIPPGGMVLDVASGSGRNALYMAARGWRVHAIDRDGEALERLRNAAAATPGCELTTEQVDLESGDVSLGTGRYQAVLVFNYLHRPLMPAIVAAVAHGGVLIYETFTRAQAARGRPTNPAFLLEDGELPNLVRPLRVLRTRSGDIAGKCIASVLARREEP